MFLRKKKNKSGSTSVQIISKERGKYKVIKSIGSSDQEQEIQKLVFLAKQEIERLNAQAKLFISESDTIVEQVFESLGNASIRTVGPEIIFGKIYDRIGFNEIKEELFRHLVIARLAFPLSKLKTIEYLYRFQGLMLDIDAVYRFLDKLNSNLKDRVEQIAFAHTLKILEGKIKNYEYIIGARLKSEPEKIKQQILGKKPIDGEILKIKRSANTRLIVSYANHRAAKDEHNRKRGLQRLEKQIKSGKLTTSSSKNKGYNKYLKLEGEISIKIDYEKFQQDNAWDGLKGYITNTKITDKQVIENYKSLWQIEKAFRMSKTDLRIRPIYHRLKHRIEAHICIAFTAYSIYKELERILYKEKSNLSLNKAAELTHNMYQITYTLPESKHQKPSF